MKSTILQLLAPAAISASLLIGCTSKPRRVVELTDSARPSDVQVREGYDTLGRKWEVFTRSESILLSYLGTIVDLDYAERAITIQGQDGHLESFFVHPNVQRLDEARVGDKVSIDYYLGVDAEVREPSYEERTNPYKVLGSTKARASSDGAPQAYDFRRVRAVATIEAIDKAAQTVTVKGPRGRYFTARVKDPSRLDRVSPGNQIVMIFTEATAVALKPQVMTRSDSVRLQYTGTISDIDYANREMTLKGADGRFETFHVDKAVQRFNEAKVGDKVSMTYYLGLSSEIRKPTAEEKQNPLVVLDASGKAGPNVPAAAFDVRQIRAVVTIEALNKAAQTVTVKGPRGKYFTTRVADPSRLDRVRIGDTVLITFSEATAISLDPATN